MFTAKLSRTLVRNFIKRSLISKLHSSLSDLQEAEALPKWLDPRKCIIGLKCHRAGTDVPAPKRAWVNTRSRSRPMGVNGRCGCNLLAVPRGKWHGFTMTIDASKANDSALPHESSEQSLIGALKGEGDIFRLPVIHHRIDCLLVVSQSLLLLIVVYLLILLNNYNIIV